MGLQRLPRGTGLRLRLQWAEFVFAFPQVQLRLRDNHAAQEQQRNQVRHGHAGVGQACGRCSSLLVCHVVANQGGAARAGRKLVAL